MTSDQQDYLPGAIAVLKGSRFLPDEVVILQVLHADGSPASGADHDPWTVVADGVGHFVTTWRVCLDDCVGESLLATADGTSSGLHAETTFTDGNECGTGVVVSVTPVGGSCSAFTPAVGKGPDNYEVQEGGTYTMTIAGVTQCSGDTITVFVQSSSTGNFCFNATGGSGTYVSTFTMPNPACNTMPISYKCGASASCNNRGTFDAAGPTSCKVHLRTANFDGNCVKTGHVTNCGTATGACCLEDGSCVDSTESNCRALGGTYQGDGSACNGVSCPPPPSGACCLEDGSCVEITEERCTGLGGTYFGDSSACPDVECTTPTGACCLDASTCVEVTEEDCESRGGFYHGDFSLCEEFDCVEDFPCGATFVLDFETDDMGNAMVHGTKVDTEYDGGPNFPVTITGSVNASGQNSAAILNSTTGPAAQDPDLLVGKGNILILQNDVNLTECPPASGVYCTHNDDDDGGTLSFLFGLSVRPASLVLVDIDATDPTSTIVLTDSSGKTRTYTVPANWTGDLVTNGPPGFQALLLDTTANQPGFASVATASEQAGFDQLDVIQIDVHLGGSGAVDDLEWCQ